MSGAVVALARAEAPADAETLAGTLGRLAEALGWVTRPRRSAASCDPARAFS